MIGGDKVIGFAGFGDWDLGFLGKLDFGDSFEFEVVILSA